ncbi:unnamed protein product [Diabrotica balteata]|uniref:Uncharacterized protein n=1 Tax=Diabrotica balteata TaxID=107213 RepID=A0A9N9XDC1_DIABA|nr:unnamed protein product [Diabrotica balteata]
MATRNNNYYSSIRERTKGLVLRCLNNDNNDYKTLNTRNYVDNNKENRGRETEISVNYVNTYPAFDSDKEKSHTDVNQCCLPTLAKDNAETLSDELQTNRFDEDDSDFEEESTRPKLFPQEELSDLIRDLNLPKNSSELIAYRLKQKNLLYPNTKITY